MKVVEPVVEQVETEETVESTEEVVVVEETVVEEVEEAKTEEIVEEVVVEDTEEEVEETVVEVVEDVQESVLEESIVDYEAMYNELQVEYGKLVAELEETKQEFSRLKEFEEKILAEQRIEEEAKIFAKFSMLENTDEFKEVKEKASQFSLDELEDMCYKIVGRLAFTEKAKAKPSKNTSVKLDFSAEKQEVKPTYYGGILG